MIIPVLDCIFIKKGNHTGNNILRSCQQIIQKHNLKILSHASYHNNKSEFPISYVPKFIALTKLYKIAVLI